MVYLLLFDRQVALVSSQRHYESVLIRRRVRLHLTHPVLGGLERCFVAQIVANNRANRVTVVHIDHRPESLMTTSVPNVHLHLLLWAAWVLRVGNAYYFLQIGTSNGDIMYFIEAVLAETEGNGRLAYG